MNKIIVYSPCRLHVAVKDMRQFDLGHVGGGGIGISVAEYSKIMIKVIDKDYESIISPNKLVIEYFLFLMRRDYLIKGHYSIKVQSNIIPHIGKGSTNTIIIGILAGLFRLNNINITDQEIVEFYLKYIKEEYAGKLVECFETGVGPWSVLKGGMVFVDEYSNWIGAVNLPPNYRVLLIQPKYRKKVTIEEESALLNQQGKTYDGLDYMQKEQLFEDMKQIFKKENIDFQRLFNLISCFQEIGSKKQEFIASNIAYEGLLVQCQNIGKEEKVQLHGISSVGPTYFYIDDFNKLLSILTKVDEKTFNMQMAQLSNGIEFFNA